MKTATVLVETPQPVQALRRVESRPASCAKVVALMRMFDLSLADIVHGSGKAISRSQLHRVLHGQRPSPFEQRAIAVGIVTCLQARCDSAFLFDQREQ